MSLDASTSNEQAAPYAAPSPYNADADQNRVSPTLHETISSPSSTQKALDASNEVIGSSNKEQQPDGEAQETAQHAVHPLSQLSAVRKGALLFIFSVSTFIDVCNVSGIALAVAQISFDIKLGLSQLVWIITSYSLCFAAFLLFAGRLSDLFPAQIVFEAGFLGLGVLSLVNSFVTSSKYGFLILRGLSGIAGSMTIPSAYHLVVQMYPEPKQQGEKLSVLGLAAALGNVLGLVLAGVCMLADYRWFFRVLGIVCITFSATTAIILPMTQPVHTGTGPRWKRLDVVGVLIMMGALICFILSLTQGPIDGWGSVVFILPFILSWILGPLFFVWEARLPAQAAVLPSPIWQTTNIINTSIVLLVPFAFWSTSQLQYATYFQEVPNWEPIHVAAALLPQGIVGLLVGGAAQSPFGGWIITSPRFTIALGAIFIVVSEILQVFSDGGNGMDYWRWCFPAFVIGSGGAILLYFASGINLVMMCPPEYSGVASAWTNVVSQVGAALCLGVQAGLQPQSITQWRKGARGFWFMLAWTVACTAQYFVFYKTPGTAHEEHENARRRIRESTIGKEKN